MDGILIGMLACVKAMTGAAVKRTVLHPLVSTYNLTGTDSPSQPEPTTPGSRVGSVNFVANFRIDGLLPILRLPTATPHDSAPREGGTSPQGPASPGRPQKPLQEQFDAKTKGLLGTQMKRDQFSESLSKAVGQLKGEVGTKELVAKLLS
jgi:hypothetical protein